MGQGELELLGTREATGRTGAEVALELVGHAVE